MILEAVSRGRKADRNMVRAAWDWQRINERYREHLAIASRLPSVVRDAKSLLDWGRTENAAWLDAVGRDPLLPRVLLPPGYLGGKAWAKRRDTLLRAGQLARLEKTACNLPWAKT